MSLFLAACFNNYAIPEMVKNWAKDAVLLELPSEKAQQFLNGANGKVWDATNSLGNFVVLTTDAGLCTVNARTAKVETLRERYLTFVKAMPPGFTTTKPLEETKSLPNGALNTIGHKVSHEKLPYDFNLVLSTSESAAAPMRVKISMSLTRR